MESDEASSNVRGSRDSERDRGQAEEYSEFWLHNSLASLETPWISLPRREHNGGGTADASDPLGLEENHPANWRYSAEQWRQGAWMERLSSRPWFKCVSEDSLSRFFGQILGISQKWTSEGHGKDLERRGCIVFDVVFTFHLHSMCLDNKVSGIR